MVGLDGDGDAIVDTDRDGESIGWTDANVDVISQAAEPAITPETITLRDQFAMAALIVMEREISRSGDDDAYIAEQAYNLADAMLAERDRAK